MALGPFGKIAIAQAVFYVPIACISFFVALKHGFNRRLGWLFLFTFSILRLVGGILTVIYRSEANPVTGIVIVATILTGIGLAPLLLATHAFLTAVTTSITHPLERPLSLSRLLLVVGFILGIVGGVDQNPTNSPSSINSGKTLTRVAVILFLVVFAFLFLMHIILWREAHAIPPKFRKLLFGISLALPPLCVRIIYSVISDFGSIKFSPTVGEWQFFLFMDLIMEYIVVLVYVVTGLRIPAQKDEDLGYPMS